MQPESHPLTPQQKRAKLLSLWALLVMVVGSIAIDQITKVTAEEKLMVWSSETNLREYQGRRYPVWEVGEPSALAGSGQFYLAFNFNYVRNQGAAWGALSEWDDTYRVPFFYLVTLMAVVVIGLYLRATPLSHRLARFALALILSGALGNFLDRIERGYVIDFLDFRWVIPLPFAIDWQLFNVHIQADAWRYNFPNFNWADSAITVGVGFLIYDMLVLEYLRKRQVRRSQEVGGESVGSAAMVRGAQ